MSERSLNDIKQMDWGNLKPSQIVAIDYLFERVQKLEETNKKNYWIASDFKFENLKLEQQNKHYRKALEFYAKRDNYKLEHFDPNLNDYMSTVDYDEGEKARKALEESE